MTNLSVVSDVQPSCINVTGAGSCIVKFGYINYINNVAISPTTGIKAAIIPGTGAVIALERGVLISTTSGASLASSMSYGLGTGNMSMISSIISVTDPDATWAIGFFLSGTSVLNEVGSCQIHVVAGSGHAGVGIWNGGSSSTIRSIANHIHVIGGTYNYSFCVNATDTIVSHYSDIIAANGAYNLGTYSYVNSPSAGNLAMSGIISSQTSETILGTSATTFVVSNNVVKLTSDSTGNTIATITGGTTGQILTLIFTDSLVTITDTAAATANTVDLSAAFTSSPNDTMQLIYDGNKWFEVSRSVN
jgi:hypothetical protein